MNTSKFYKNVTNFKISTLTLVKKLFTNYVFDYDPPESKCCNFENAWLSHAADIVESKVCNSREKVPDNFNLRKNALKVLDKQYSEEL